jgi:hypothetical protein
MVPLTTDDQKTGNLEAVRKLLGHTKIETTARYLGELKQADHVPSVGPTNSDFVGVLGRQA